MATKDGFRLIPADRAEKPEQPDSAQPGSATSWRREMIKAAFLGATAAAIALAIVSYGNPGALVTNATAFLASLTAPQDGKVEEVPVAQSSAEIQSGTGVQASNDAQASPPTAAEPTANEPTPGEPKDGAKASDKASEKTGEPPADNNVTAPVKTADQTDTGQATTGYLLGRFQAWAARDNAQADAQPAQPSQQPAPLQAAAAQPVQETQANPTQANSAQAKPDPGQDAGPVQDARAEIESAPNHRTVRHAKHVRAEIRPKQAQKQTQKQDHKPDHKQDHRAKLRREQDARLQAQRIQEVREQERPIVQTNRSPSFLESLGLRE